MSASLRGRRLEICPYRRSCLPLRQGNRAVNTIFLPLNNGSYLFISYLCRCILPTIDPATGIKDPNQEPLRTLRKYVHALIFDPRRCVLFVCKILSFILFSPLSFRSLVFSSMSSCIDTVLQRIRCCVKLWASLLSWESV